jgi:hypothetical protein
MYGLKPVPFKPTVEAGGIQIYSLPPKLASHAAWYPRSQRRIHEYARQPGAPTSASDQTLVAVARALHLPAEALARAAHPDST